MDNKSIFNKKYQLVKYTGIILNAIYIIYIIKSLIQKSYVNIVTLLICFIINIIVLHNSKKLYIKFSNLMNITIIIFVFFSSFLGSTLKFYKNIHHYDDIMHFISGIIITIFAYDLVRIILNKSVYIKLPRKFIILFVLIFNLAIAGLWEMVEYIIDNTFNQNMQGAGLNDTMIDMIDATIASVVTTFVVELFYKNKKYS